MLARDKIGFYVAAIFVAFFVCGGASAQTKDLPGNAFFGEWTGSGVAQSEENITFQYSQRDLNVTITPVGSGFSVAWTTVQRQKGDPKQPLENRKATTMTFVPVGRPNVWRAMGALDPIGGNAYSWVKLKGQTLTINAFQIEPDGTYEM
ncbi:MAG: hypothetical protein EXQ91_02245 [Alphaproteobacteria bacterium]|nr:hypothetical protein [Alphaproteobacteria bacterium]